MGYTLDGTGFQKRETSFHTAVKQKDKKRHVHDAIIAIIRRSLTPVSADDLAAAMGQSVISIRPRVSELATSGRIVDSGSRGETALGRPCILWRLPRDADAEAVQ